MSPRPAPPLLGCRPSSRPAQFPSQSWLRPLGSDPGQNFSLSARSTEPGQRFTLLTRSAGDGPHAGLPVPLLISFCAKTVSRFMLPADAQSVALGPLVAPEMTLVAPAAIEGRPSSFSYKPEHFLVQTEIHQTFFLHWNLMGILGATWTKTRSDRVGSTSPGPAVGPVQAVLEYRLRSLAGSGLSRLFRVA